MAHMPRHQKATVSERALFARIDRALKKDGATLRRCRPDSRRHSEVGTFYVVDLRRNRVRHKDVDLEALAREMGALKDWEVLHRG
jgi:hypothetical protein